MTSINKSTFDEKLTTEDALKLFDELEAVNCDFMLGQWKGREVITGHPMDGILKLVGWHGKSFIDADTVHPLLMYRNNSQLFSINPGLMPLGLMKYRLPKLKVYKPTLQFLRLLIQTRKGKARLRMLEHRGKVSAAMCYDQLPVNDCFRKIDDNSVLGVMDQKGSQTPYFFILERDDTHFRLPF